MPLSVSCPECAKTLQIRDESFLGKKVRCPNCQNVVILRLPDQTEDDDEVLIELIDPITPVPPSRPTPAPTSAPRAASAPAAPPVAPSPSPVPVARPAARPAAGPFGIVEEEEEPAASGAAAEHLRRMIEQKKRRSRNNAVLIVGVLGIAGIAGAIAIPMLNSAKMPVATAPAAGTPSAPGGPAQIPVAAGVVTEEDLNRQPELLAEFRPTGGKPIDLRMVPDGVNFLIHLRPARLWANDEAMTELRSCLTEPVVKWIEGAIQRNCHRTPDQIDELLVAVVLGPTGSPPQIAAVVNLVAPAKPSDLIEEFKGQIVKEAGNARLITNGQNYFVVSGLQQFAIGPANATTEIEAALTTPNETIPDGVLEVVRQSDRDRMFTIIFEIDDVRRNVDMLFAPVAIKAVNNVLDWFGEDVATVGWSAHLGETFHSEFTFFPKGSRSGRGVVATPRVVQETFRMQLPDMPLLLVEAVKKMNPPTAGFRQIIGRFPAMMQAVALQTAATVNARTARLTTVLPAKAAPNLALGTLLTWDESTRTNFASAPAVDVADTKPALPDKVEDRLRVPVDCDVTLPLEPAFAYLLGEVGVEVFVDGNALKLSGITKNEVQTLKLGKTPPFKAIQAILNRSDRTQTYPDIVLSIDQAAKKVTVTTKADAAAKGLPIFDIRGMK